MYKIKAEIFQTTDTDTKPGARPLAFGLMTISTSRSNKVSWIPAFAGMTSNSTVSRPALRTVRKRLTNRALEIHPSPFLPRRVGRLGAKLDPGAPGSDRATRFRRGAIDLASTKAHHSSINVRNLKE